MQSNRVSAVLVALSLPLSLSIGAAYAEEKTLEFQLVTKYLDPQTLEAKNIEDQTITQARAFGVAVFKDGRIGTKDFIVAIDKRRGAGTYFGYSTYTFDDGSITARFTGTPQGGHGDYKILSGTGAYTGATGTGTFDRLPNPLTATGRWDVKLQMTTQVASK